MQGTQSGKRVNHDKRRKSGFFNRKERAEITRYKAGIDRIFLIVVIVMVCAGTAMIFSASYVNALSRHGDSFFFVRRQIIMAAIGIALMILATYLADYRFIKKLALPFFILILVINYLTPVLGVTISGGHRWIMVPLIGQFQPSELLKLRVVLFFAWYIDKMGERMHKAKWGIGVPAAIIGVIGLAMLMQSHFSGFIILACICITIIFIGEAPWQYIGAFVAICVGGIISVWVFSDRVIEMLGVRGGRIISWVSPFEDPRGYGFQIIQSLYAIASGGLTGVGLGQSRQKFLYLPEPQNDFIFSIIAEELGFIGAIIIISMFVILIWRGIIIAHHAPDKFSAFVVIGIIIKVAVQFILNLLVVTNTIPNTGIPLPFFSYGGTALVVLLIEMGIILCISRYSYQEKA